MQVQEAPVTLAGIDMPFRFDKGQLSVKRSQIQFGVGSAFAVGLGPTTFCGVCAVAVRPRMTPVARINENRVTLPLLRRERDGMREALYKK